MQISKTGVSLLIIILAYFKVDVSDNDVMEFVGAVMQVVSFTYLIWKQIARTETVAFLLKRWQNKTLVTSFYLWHRNTLIAQGVFCFQTHAIINGMSSSPDWESKIKRIYCSQCSSDITFSGECTECLDGLIYNEWVT